MMTEPETEPKRGPGRPPKRRSIQELASMMLESLDDLTDVEATAINRTLIDAFDLTTKDFRLALKRLSQHV